jgi:hypothetical protein
MKNSKAKYGAGDLTKLARIGVENATARRMQALSEEELELAAGGVMKQEGAIVVRGPIDTGTAGFISPDDPTQPIRMDSGKP